MIVLDGVVYQAHANGTINVMPDNETIPFAVITNFNEDNNLSGISAKNLNDLTKQLDKEIEKLGKNNIYVVKIEGNFSNITVRSVEKQNTPYKEFTEVAKADQRVFNYTNQSGTLVAIYFPEYMDDLNMHGWHIHFLSADKTKGGHVLGLNMTNATASIDSIHEFNMILPTSPEFEKMNFTENMNEQIHRVE